MNTEQRILAIKLYEEKSKKDSSYVAFRRKRKYCLSVDAICELMEEYAAAQQTQVPTDGEIALRVS